MALPVEEIKQLITSSIPDASIEIKDLMGDNNHYSAEGGNERLGVIYVTH